MRSRTCGASRTTSQPPTLAAPAVGSSSVFSSRCSVVFPAPLGPKSPNSSPDPTRRDISLTAATPTNRRVSPTHSTAGAEPLTADHHAVGAPAGPDGGDDAQRGGVDDRDVIRPSVGRIDLSPVGSHRHPPRPPPHLLGDGGDDRAAPRVNDEQTVA